MKKALKFLSLGLALVICMSMAATPVFAADQTLANGENAKPVEVTVTNTSIYTVIIPKTLSATDSKYLAYNVSVSGDIAGTEQVTVTPDASFILSSEGKTDVTAIVDIDDAASRIFTKDEVVAGTIAVGTIDISGCTAGTWTGSFNFNISLENTASNSSEPSVNLISFNIGNKTYQAEEDMTWEEWINSEYNDGTGPVLKEGSTLLYKPTDDFYVLEGHSMGEGAKTSSIIVAGKTYSYSPA